MIIGYARVSTTGQDLESDQNMCMIINAMIVSKTKHIFNL